MTTKAEWKAAAERRLAENVALRILINQLEDILQGPILDRIAGVRRINRALKKIAVAKEVGK